MLLYEDLTKEVIGAAIEVHKTLGPGLFERPYEEAFCHELELRSIPFRRQVLCGLQYKGLQIPDAYRVDVIVNEVLIVENKAVLKVLPEHEAQILTYLKLMEKRIGLLFNYHSPTLIEGMRRFVL